MDSLELLAREDEFKKLNKQLEKKTESLMKEIEHAMQKQDIFSEFSHNLTLSPYNTPTKIKKHCCDTPKLSSVESTPTKIKNNKKTTKETAKEKKECNSQSESLEFKNGSQKCVGNATDDVKCVTVVCNCCVYESRKERVTEDLEFLYAFVSVNVKENVLPASFIKERATVESVCKFLSSKVKLMQEQIDSLQSTIDKKAKQCEIHLTHQAELEKERMTLLNKCNNLHSTANDMRAKYQATVKRLEEKDRLYKEQRSESDKLSSEVKRLRSKNAALEARCSSLDGAVDKLTQQLEHAKKAEKDFRDSTRSLSAAHQSTITQLDSQIKSLHSHIQRQHKLIHNLREQRALLTAEGAVGALEREFNVMLMKD